MISLNVETVLVESFPTTETPGEPWPGASALGLEGCEQAFFAPITVAHTDPCESCCKEM